MEGEVLHCLQLRQGRARTYNAYCRNLIQFTFGAHSVLFLPTFKTCLKMLGPGQTIIYLHFCLLRLNPAAKIKYFYFTGDVAKLAIEDVE